jgi:hypothetical protein
MASRGSPDLQGTWNISDPRKIEKAPIFDGGPSSLLDHYPTASYFSSLISPASEDCPSVTLIPSFAAFL